MPAVTPSHSAVVNASVRQIMKVVTSEVDANKDKKIDEDEAKALMAKLDRLGSSDATDVDSGRLPPESVRIDMAICHTLGQMSEDPKFKDADIIKLTDFRKALKANLDTIIKQASVPDDGFIGGLGVLLSTTLLPDVAVRHVADLIAARDR